MPVGELFINIFREDIMKKKILITLISAMIIASLTACEDKTSTEPDTTSENSVETEISTTDESVSDESISDENDVEDVENDSTDEADESVSSDEIDDSADNNATDNSAATTDTANSSTNDENNVASTEDEDIYNKAEFLSLMGIDDPENYVLIEEIDSESVHKKEEWVWIVADNGYDLEKDFVVVYDDDGAEIYVPTEKFEESKELLASWGLHFSN